MPRTTASAWETKAVPLAVRFLAAAAFLLSPSSFIDAALRAHHKRKLFRNPYVTGRCSSETHAVSNKLTHGVEEKKKDKN